MIIASAIKLTNGEIYVGKRHCDCFQNLISIKTKTGLYSNDELRKLHISCEQGFVDSSLRFLDRYEAYFEAYECSQCKEQDLTDNTLPCLMSEDLW